MTKIDIQLFRASLRAVEVELKPLHESIPQRVFDELQAMELVIDRDLKDEH